MKRAVSAIVPVFNEEKTVGGVVKTLLANALINDVICVNDGSTDKSPEILKSFGGRIKLIDFKRNYGKGFALCAGIKKAKGEIVAFFDSDLPNLSQKHIRTLLEPILEENFPAVIGVPRTSKDDYLTPWAIYLAGERAYSRKKLLPHLKRMAKTRYGIEIYLNTLFDKKETKVVTLDGLILPPKQVKRTPRQALREYLVEAVEVAQEIGKKEGLLPKNLDYKKVANLAKTKSFEDLKARINEIKNRKVKGFLDNYVLKYIALAKKKLQVIK